MGEYYGAEDLEPMQDYGAEEQDAASDAYEAALNLGRDVAAEAAQAPGP